MQPTKSSAADIERYRIAELADIGSSPEQWEGHLSRLTSRTATSLELEPGARLEDISLVLHALRATASSIPWHLGDLMLAVQERYPEHYEALLDIEGMPDGQTGANIRSICRAVPPALRDSRLSFWKYVPLVPLLRSEDDTVRDAGIALIDIAARGGWTREQIGQAARDTKRALSARTEAAAALLEKKLEDMAARSEPLPPTVTRVIDRAPAAVLPGSKDLKRVISAAVIGSAGNRLARELEIRMLLGDTEIDCVARAVALWLQTDAPREFIERVLASREEHEERQRSAAATDIEDR